MKKILHITLFIIFSFSAFAFEIKKNEADSLLAIKMHREGIKALQLGDFELALDRFQKVYVLRAKIYGTNSTKLASPLINMGIQYKNLGSIDKAIESYKKVEYLFSKNSVSDNINMLGTAYINLSVIYGERGDYNQSLEYQKNALRILATDSLKSFRNFQDSKYNIAELQLKLGYSREVISFALKSLKTSTTELKSRLYDLLALAYRNEGNFNLSEKSYINAINSCIKSNGNNNFELISKYLSYSSFLMSQKKYEEALVYSSKAKSIVLDYYNEKSRTYAEVLSSFGDYYYLKNSEVGQIDDVAKQRKYNLTEAIQYYQDAIVSLVDSFQTKDPFVEPPLKNIISEIQMVEILKKKSLAMEKLAEIYLSELDNKNSLKYFDASLKSLSNAITLIHKLQIGFENEDSKLFLSQNQESTFYEAVSIAFKLYKLTQKSEYLKQAFELSERGKASNLLASIKDMKAKEFGGIPDSLLQKEKDFKNYISNYNSKLFEESHSLKPDSQKVNLYSAKIFKYNEEYNRLIDSFEKSYPEYYTLKYENKVVSIDEIQSRLNKRQALVEFFIKEPDSYAENGELFRFVITKDSASLSKETINADYLRDIQVVHDFLINPNYMDTRKSDFVKYSFAAHNLYDILLKQDARKLKDKALTIVPHNKLSYIPFDALISQLPDTSTMNFRNLKYLIRDYPINYSYSATLLFDYSKNKKSSKRNLLIFSPKYIANEPRLSAESPAPLFFNPLPGAEDEVKGISKYMRADSFVDLSAQEASFKNNAPEYDILHLAMHTVINDTLPMFSKLVFSRPDQTSGDDGYLNTFEIYNMKLHARLAVLSACETGTGMLQKGEGVMSMARAFIYAGCPSIVMTLWQVEDKSGAKIMDDFYYYLSQGKRKDVALRMAKLKHLENSDPLMAHPHFWLGYVNIGDPEAIKNSKDFYFIILIFVFALLLSSDWYFRRKRRKNRSQQQVSNSAKVKSVL
jgi:CHAT domain-containing protein/tetratricopeptide (TPR) repeat protein